MTLTDLFRALALVAALAFFAIMTACGHYRISGTFDYVSETKPAAAMLPAVKASDSAR
jgi:hypothetical protein